MKKPIAQVTDHAVLRYLERVKGVDIEQLRREIGRKVDLHNDHPGACGVNADGFRYTISQTGKVITVHAQNQPKLHSGRNGAKGERDD